MRWFFINFRSARADKNSCRPQKSAIAKADMKEGGTSIRLNESLKMPIHLDREEPESTHEIK